MKKIVLFLSVLVVALAACNSPQAEKQQTKKKEISKAELLTNIQQEEKALFGDDAAKIDRRRALKLVDDYQQFAGRFPNDTAAPGYLFKASDISMNMGKPGQTVAIFEKLIKQYPDYNKIETCYFLRAFVYDDQLKDYKKARQYYQEFLKKYPDSDFADDAAMLLKNMGKTPEELIKEFGNK